MSNDACNGDTSGVRTSVVHVPYTKTYSYREVQALSETHGVANASLSSSSPYHGPCSSCRRDPVDLEWFATRIGRFYCEACGPAARHEARGTHYRVVRITQPPWTEDVMTRERDRADARRAQELEAQTDER